MAECWDEMKVERIDLVIDLEQKMAADSAQVLDTSHGKLVPNMLGRLHCLR